MVRKKDGKILENSKVKTWLWTVQFVNPNLVAGLKYMVNLPTEVVRVASFQNTMVRFTVETGNIGLN
jgi:hypothetical protein